MESGWEDTLPDVAVIEPVPDAIPVTRPVSFTLMTVVGDATYVIFALGMVTPFTSRAIAVNCSDSPTAIVAFGAVMTTVRMGALTGSLEHAVSSIVAASSAALLMNPQLVPRQAATEVVAGCATYWARQPHATPAGTHRALPLTFLGLEMRRLALMAAIAVALPASGRAQACLGSVSFGVIPVRLGGGAFFGKDYTGYGLSLIAGKDNAAFGLVGVSRAYFDDYDDTDDEVFAEVGWQREVGTRAQLCPIVGVSFGTGPDGDGFEVKSRLGSAGAALGMTLQPRPSVKFIPNASLLLEYGAVDVTDQASGKQTYSDTFGVADLGLGITLFRDRLAIAPTVRFPFAADDNSVSYGISFSVGIAVGR